MGCKLSTIWKILWTLAPLIILGLAIWGFVTLDLTGWLYPDPIWMYSVGWGIVLICFLIILIVAIYKVYDQVDYNFVQVRKNNVFSK